MRESDVILFVVDAQHGLAPVDQELATMLRKARTPVVLVINKIDHPNHEALESDFARLNFAHTVPISAAHDRGISELLKTIDELLPDTSNIKHQTSNVELPVALAIIGRPNAGKSSLINSILRDQRTIVSEISGRRATRWTLPTSAAAKNSCSSIPPGCARGANIRPRLKSSA